MVEDVLVWGDIPDSFPLMVLGSCRAGGEGIPHLPSFCRGHSSPAVTAAALQAMCARIYGGVSPDCISKNPLLWSKSSFFWAVFSSIPLAQWILNRDVATATLLGFTLLSGTGLYDCSLRCNACSYVISLCDHWWNPHCHCACFRNWARFWRCHLKASRGMNFNEYIRLATWDIPSNGIT